MNRKALILGSVLAASLAFGTTAQAHDSYDFPYGLVGGVLLGLHLSDGYYDGHRHHHHERHYHHRDYRRSDSHGYQYRDRYKHHYGNGRLYRDKDKYERRDRREHRRD